jgi:hypothetical protein
MWRLVPGFRTAGDTLSIPVPAPFSELFPQVSGCLNLSPSTQARGTVGRASRTAPATCGPHASLRELTSPAPLRRDQHCGSSLAQDTPTTTTLVNRASNPPSPVSLSPSARARAARCRTSCSSKASADSADTSFVTTATDASPVSAVTRLTYSPHAHVTRSNQLPVRSSSCRVAFPVMGGA